MKATTADLHELLSVATAELGLDGVLLSANAGFLRLLGRQPAERIGSRVGHFFVQPKFAMLLTAAADKDGLVHRGLMTMGDFTSNYRTLRGRVWRDDKGLSLLAEHDIEELERLTDSLQELNRESLQTQRMLGGENRGLKQREAQMAETSLTDALTGVGNRRKLEQALATEIARSVRTGDALSVFMADIDHFKRINDSFGHPAGDRVLARFGSLLREQCRPTDTVSRFGGEEFVVLLPHTREAQAREVAERIRRTLAQECLDPPGEPVTASFGVAQLRAGETAESLMARVDAAMYQAKESGRNRVFASESAE